MSDAEYKVVFSGDLVAGFDIADVKSNFAKIAKTDMTKLERYFLGSELTIKANIDYQTALKLQSTFRKYGAECHIKPPRTTSATTEVISAPPPMDEAENKPASGTPEVDESDAVEYVPANRQKDTMTQNVILGGIAIIVRLVWSLTIGFIFFLIGTIAFIVLDILFPKYSVSYKVLTTMYKWGSCHWFKRLRLEVDEYSVQVEKKR